MVEGSALVLSTDIDHMDILQRLQEQDCAILRKMPSCTSKGKGVISSLVTLNMNMKKIIAHIPLDTGTHQLNLLYLGLAT